MLCDVMPHTFLHDSRHMKTLIRTCRHKETKSNKVRAHTALVTLIEGYFESASQLVLQLYLSIIIEHEETVSTSKSTFSAEISRKGRGGANYGRSV